MTFTLKLLSVKKIYLVMGFGIGLIFLTTFYQISALENLELFGIPALFLLLPIIIISLVIIPVEKHDLKINPDNLEFNGQTILYSDIKGHYLNADSPVMTLFDIELKNGKKIRICSSDFGQNKKEFNKFVDTLTATMKGSENKISDLKYGEIYKTEYKIMKPVFIVLIAATVILNAYSFYMFFTEDIAIFSRLILINGMALGIYGYIRRK